MYSDLSIQELLRALEELGDQVPMELVQAILAKEPEAVIPLRDILQDDQSWEAQGNKQWMPLHAVKLLGTMADLRALPQLVNTLIQAYEVEDEWIMEDLPTVFGRIGPPAIDLLEEFIQAYEGDDKVWWSRSAAADGLVAIAMNYPCEQECILTFLHGLFSEDDDPIFLSFLVKSLLNLGDTTSFPILEEAFDRGIIDEFIIARDDLNSAKKVPRNLYNKDLLDFYGPEEVARRKKRWDKEKDERERYETQKLEEREKSISIELKRLEIANILNERNILPFTGKVGRNEPCPCGSGKKFKKCCFSIFKDLPVRQVLSNGFYYNIRDDLHKAAPYDTILVLENLTFLAFDAARDGDVDRALELFKILKPLAEQRGFLGELLHNWELICLDHPELAEDGLDILRQLQSFLKDKDQETWVFTSMNIADYIGLMGRWDECKNEYKKLTEVMPDYPLVRIRFARLLERNNYINEAVASYEHVLQMGDQADEEDLETAAGELRDLAARHKIELVAWTREAIDDILSGERW